MTSITQHELNDLYCRVNSLYKAGRVSNTTDIVMPNWNNSVNLVFRFDRKMGTVLNPEGRWLLKTKVNVIFLDDDSEPSADSQDL